MIKDLVAACNELKTKKDKVLFLFNHGFRANEIADLTDIIKSNCSWYISQYKKEREQKRVRDEWVKQQLEDEQRPHKHSKYKCYVS